MSALFLPTLAGLSWNTTKRPEFNTSIQRSVNLSEVRVSFASAPIWNFGRSYDLLRDDVANNELKTLMSFFTARYGDWDSWLFLDTDDSVATLQPFGTGDAATVAFQLKRTLVTGGLAEPVSNIAASPAIYKGGVLQTVTTDYTVSATGLVTFTVAPAAAAALTWSGTYYFRCRFKNSMQEYLQFMSKLWEARSFDFVGALGTKI